MVTYGFSRVENGWMVFANGIADDGIGRMSPLRLRRLFVEDDVSASNDEFASVEEVPDPPPTDNDDDSSDDDNFYFDCQQSLTPESLLLSPLIGLNIPLPPFDEEEESSDPDIDPPKEKLGSFWDEKGRRRSWRLRLKAGLGAG